MTPQRIHRQRLKGSKLPPNTVVVTRGTRFGNPFKIGWRVGYSAQDAVSDHRRWLLHHRGVALYGPPPTCEEIIESLRGKNLACWCPIGQACHADTLLEIANVPDVPAQELIRSTAS